MDQVRTTRLQKMKSAGEKIPCLTAYDASFATLLAAAGVPVLLVGDSLGNVIQGHSSTLPVTLDDMLYHTAAVARGAAVAEVGALVVADMPFGSYNDPAAGLSNAQRLMQAGAQMVKLEGGNAAVIAVVERLTAFGVPVCGHLGLLPQSVHKLGGYRVQGREPEAAAAIIDSAQALQAAGADLLVIEAVPSALGASVSAALEIPVIGIGAGPDCDGQVLVLYDMLGLSPGPRPKFSRDFLADGGSLEGAVRAYVSQVRDGSFPAPEHEYR